MVANLAHKYDCSNLLQFAGIFLTSPENCHHNSQVVFNQKRGFGHLLCLSGHNPLSTGKELLVLESLLTVFLEVLTVF